MPHQADHDRGGGNSWKIRLLDSITQIAILMPAACIVYKPSIFAAPLSAAEELGGEGSG